MNEILGDIKVSFPKEAAPENGFPVYYRLDGNSYFQFGLGEHPLTNLDIEHYGFIPSFAMYAMYKSEHVFDNFILISASVWFKDFISYMETSSLSGEFNIYMYVGEQEGIYKTNVQKDTVPNSIRAFDILKEGFIGANHRLKLETDPLGTHNDSFFLQYFPNGIRFLYPAK